MVYTQKIPVWWVSLLSNEKKRRHNQRAPEVVAFIRENVHITHHPQRGLRIRARTPTGNSKKVKELQDDLENVLDDVLVLPCGDLPTVNYNNHTTSNLFQDGTALVLLSTA